MKIPFTPKLFTLIACLFLVAVPITSIYAQEEPEEEEEPLQARPNPAERATQMRGANPNWDPTDRNRARTTPRTQGQQMQRLQQMNQMQQGQMPQR